MWSLLRKLFRTHSDADVSEAEEGNIQTDGNKDGKTWKPEESSHGNDSRKFDITGCDDIEIEEIDGELH